MFGFCVQCGKITLKHRCKSGMMTLTKCVFGLSGCLLLCSITLCFYKFPNLLLSVFQSAEFFDMLERMQVWNFHTFHVLLFLCESSLFLYCNPSYLYHLFTFPSPFPPPCFRSSTTLLSHNCIFAVVSCLCDQDVVRRGVELLTLLWDAVHQLFFSDQN